MKRILTIIFLFISIAGFSQKFQQTIGNKQTLVKAPYAILADSLLAHPLDTFWIFPSYRAYQFEALKGDSSYQWSARQQKWILKTKNPTLQEVTTQGNTTTNEVLISTTDQGSFGLQVGSGAWMNSLRINNNNTANDRVTFYDGTVYVGRDASDPVLKLYSGGGAVGIYSGGTLGFNVGTEYLNMYRLPLFPSSPTDYTANITHAGVYYNNQTFKFRGNINGTWKNFLMEGDVTSGGSYSYESIYVGNYGAALATDDSLLHITNDSTILARRIRMVAGTNVTISETGSNDSLMVFTISASGGGGSAGTLQQTTDLGNTTTTTTIFGATSSPFSGFTPQLGIAMGTQEVGLAIKRTTATDPYSWFELQDEANFTIFRMNELGRLLIGTPGVSSMDAGIQRVSTAKLRIIDGSGAYGDLEADDLYLDGDIEVSGLTTLRQAVYIKTNILAVTTYGVTTGDFYIELASGASTITLPSATPAGRILVIRNPWATAGSFGGGTVKDASDATVTTIAANTTYTLIANNTNWVITSRLN